MKSRSFGGSATSVSEVGLGCWQLGGADWGDITEADSLAILNAAVDSGVTVLDTADVYGLGQSERAIGRFLKSRSDHLFVATKLGRYPDPGWPDNFTAAAMRTHTEASLRRLGVETVDLTQLHCIPTEELRRGDVFETLRELQREGKVRAFGASVESMEEALICLDQPDLVSLQIIFNIVRQKPIETVFERALKQGVAIIVRLPLASGLLTGKFTHATTFAPTDHRTYNRDGQAFNVGETFAGLPFDAGVDLAADLAQYTPSGMSMTQMALRWCLDYDAVTTIIPGAKSPEMARANAAVSGLAPLDPTLHTALAKFYRSRVERLLRGPN